MSRSSTASLSSQALDMSADVDAPAFRQAMSLFATGVTVITTRVGAQRAGMTASAVCSLSIEPIQLLVCIGHRLPTHSALSESRRFAVNVLSEEQAMLARRFATPDIDKFAGVAASDHLGVPVLHGALAAFVCDVSERLPGGDHSIFIGRVRAAARRDGARPLLYFASGFGTLATTEDALMKAWIERGATL